ncbi:hypothetical protein BFL17_14085 [Escherichia coli]|nr:hypothetical protein BFL17_14085 [Escherichia coli]
MLTGAFLCLPYGGMPEADSLKHQQQFYLTLALQQTVLPDMGIPIRNEFSSPGAPSKTQPGSKHPQQQ